MDKIINTTDGQITQEQALENVRKQYRKMLRRMSRKEWEELDDEIYATTRVTIDNLTADDL